MKLAGGPAAGVGSGAKSSTAAPRAAPAAGIKRSTGGAPAPVHRVPGAGGSPSKDVTAQLSELSLKADGLEKEKDL